MHLAGCKTDKTAMLPVTSLYESIGVRTVINARGTITVLGASRILPEVQQAMDEAVAGYVQIDELMDGVGKRLAELTGAESGCITAGASAAITAATAGCVTGGDPDKIWMIPDNIAGMKNEVIITSYSRTAYDAAARAVGVKMIEVETLAELKSALRPSTAMIMILAGSASENGPLSLKEISAEAKKAGVPVLVDAAAEGLELPNPHLSQGADLVAYSGGKYLNGPQCAGLLLGRKDLIYASRMNTGPHHGFGRGFKVGREEIMGMLAAVEMWFRRDHQAELKLWNSRLEYIAGKLQDIPGVTVNIRQPRGRSNPSPGLAVSWDIEKIPLKGIDAEQALWDGNPRIAVSGFGSFLPFPPNESPNISINSSQLADGDEIIIADSVYRLLSAPPAITLPTGAPAQNIAGQWELEMKFYASTVSQSLKIEQNYNQLAGTHTGSIGQRNISGTIYGNEVLIRSSYGKDGARINIEFKGEINGNTMHGDAILGEYGTATWSAKKI
jgi:L-seryl-tRNA(Ser) seleniumtransferase